MHCFTKGNRLSPEASPILFMRIRPIPLPSSLGGHRDQRFVLQLAAPQALFESAQLTFLDCPSRGQQIPPRPHHRAPHFVQPGPSRFVAVQPQHSWKSPSAGCGLLGGDPPHRTKPQRQRAARALQDRPCGHRGLAPTRSALQQHCSPRPGLSTTATRTVETVRPAQPEQILPTVLLTHKTGLELYQVPRVIFHLLAYYILGLPESTGYPPFGKMFRLGVRSETPARCSSTAPRRGRQPGTGLERRSCSNRPTSALTAQDLTPPFCAAN